MNLGVRPARQRDLRTFHRKERGEFEEVVRVGIPGSIWISTLLQERTSDSFEQGDDMC